jgi:hypothetical protein
VPFAEIKKSKYSSDIKRLLNGDSITIDGEKVNIKDHALIPVEEHNGSAHPQYSKRVKKIMEEFNAKTTLSPEATGKDAVEFAKALVSEVDNTTDAYVSGFNNLVREGRTPEEMRIWGKAMLAAEAEATKVGKVLMAGKTLARWAGKTCEIIQAADFAFNLVSDGPSEASRQLVRDVTFYSVTVEPVAIWFERTNIKAKEGKLNSDSQMGNYFNTLRNGLGTPGTENYIDLDKY